MCFYVTSLSNDDGQQFPHSYFNTESVPERVRRMDPRVLLLLVVRDPVTRLISDYTQIMHNHVERGLAPKSFEELVFLNNATQEVNTRYDAVGKSMYDVHMRRWLKHFPLEQIHVVNGDRLIRKPWQELVRDSCRNVQFSNLLFFFCG